MGIEGRRFTSIPGGKKDELPSYIGEEVKALRAREAAEKTAASAHPTPEVEKKPVRSPETLRACDAVHTEIMFMLHTSKRIDPHNDDVRGAVWKVLNDLADGTYDENPREAVKEAMRIIESSPGHHDEGTQPD